MKYKVQVDKAHYFNKGYLDENRMLSYYHQINLVRKVSSLISKEKLSILEIGIGNGIVRDILGSLGHRVKTLDIDSSLNPDVVATLPNIKLKEKYDCILCCEVLEHIKFKDVQESFENLSKISNYLIVSVPNKTIYLSLNIKLPFLPLKGIIFSIPFYYIPHTFKGEHYWEIGAFGINPKKLKDIANKFGFDCVLSFRIKTHPWHNFFLFSKKEETKKVQ